MHQYAAVHPLTGRSSAVQDQVRLRSKYAATVMSAGVEIALGPATAVVAHRDRVFTIGLRKWNHANQFAELRHHDRQGGNIHFIFFPISETHPGA
jgi:hypothetical protein